METTIREIANTTKELEKRLDNHQWFIDNMHQYEINTLKNQVDTLQNMLNSIIVHYNIKMCVVCNKISDDVTEKQCNYRENHCYAERCNCTFMCCNQCYNSHLECKNHQ